MALAGCNLSAFIAGEILDNMAISTINIMLIM